MGEPKTVVVTGATRGLGRALAGELIRLGHVVVGCGTNASAVAALRSDWKAPHDIAVVDVTVEDQVRAWAERMIARLGPPDLLLNNAAVINANAPLWKVSAAEFGRVVDVNIKGVAHVIRHFAPSMIRQGRGVIVNFSSGWGRSTDAEVAPYCATKWAIEGLTRALAQELPRGMAAIPLNPGIINTAMLRRCFGDSASAYPSPEEWARRAVPFLLKLGARDNGQPLTVE